MKKLFLLSFCLSLMVGCAGVKDQTHTLKHPDGRRTECITPGGGGLSLIFAKPLAEAPYGRNFHACMDKAKGEGFVEEVKK